MTKVSKDKLLYKCTDVIFGVVPELCNAATKIQASFRGHMARKAAPKGKADEDLSKELQKLDAKVR